MYVTNDDDDDDDDTYKKRKENVYKRTDNIRAELHLIICKCCNKVSFSVLKKNL